MKRPNKPDYSLFVYANIIIFLTTVGHQNFRSTESLQNDFKAMKVILSFVGSKSDKFRLLLTRINLVTSRS